MREPNTINRAANRFILSSCGLENATELKASVAKGLMKNLSVQLLSEGVIPFAGVDWHFRSAPRKPSRSAYREPYRQITNL